ncbi:hypothetical protein HMPREF1013_00821 [Bacillus sp. 2_A_57_CT2]|nr:hypothetical protein HMPREF1013_00821 [Bacillus sp. 2_A_57_CT2]
MNYRYFPDDQKVLDALLKVFSKQIEYRADKIKDNIADFEGIIIDAMAILRILDPTGARNYSRAKERVKIIKKKWPNIPDAPNLLRIIRNKFEHFEEYYDEWFSTAQGPHVSDIDSTFLMLYRVDHYDKKIYYMEHELSIIDVKRWVQGVNQIINKK